MRRADRHGQHRSSYSAKFKIQIIDRIAAGETLMAVSQETGINKTQIQRWRKDEISLRALPMNSRKRIIGTRVSFPELEQRLAVCIKERYEQGLIVRDHIITSQAKKIKEELITELSLDEGEESAANINKLKAFNLSVGWRDRFKKRFNFGSFKICNFFFNSSYVLLFLFQL